MKPVLTHNSTKKINSVTKSLYESYFNAIKTRTNRPEGCFGRVHMNSTKKNMPSFTLGTKWSRYVLYKCSGLIFNIVKTR
jgi:hypothetical protein